MDFLIDLGYIGALKTAVGERLGIETGDPRPPNLGATTEQKTAAREAVHRLGLAKVA